MTMPTASASDPTPKTSTSRTTAASRALAAGTMSRVDAASAGLHRHRQRPGDRPHGAVEGQFADGGEAFELVGRDLPGGDEHAQRDGQVERAGVLSQVGGGEVDDGAAHGQPVAEVDQRPLDAVDALADGQFGQADEHGLGQLRRGRVHLHLDRHRVDADQGEGAELGEHEGSRNLHRRVSQDENTPIRGCTGTTQSLIFSGGLNSFTSRR